MEILYAFAGLGGSVERLHELGDFNVTAIEINHDVASAYQKRFPAHKVVVGDAYEFIKKKYYKYDVIFACPECPTHSRFRRVNNGKWRKKGEYPELVYPDMGLYQLIIVLEAFYDGKWAVENVISYYDPLIDPYVIGRHYVWSNVRLGKRKFKPKRISRNHKGNREDYISYMEKQLGVELPRDKILLPDTTGRMRDDTVYRNVMDPDTGLFIFERLINPKKPEKWKFKTIQSYCSSNV